METLKIQKYPTTYEPLLNKWDGVQQAREFYEQAPKHMAQLQKFEATPEAFGQNEAAVQALLALKAQRLDRKGKTESSTQQRN